METRLVHRLSASEYHADPCSTPSLTASIAHVLDRQSPLHAHLRHPKFGAVPRKDTPAFDRGTLSHALLLGEDKEIEIVQADDWRTKAAQKTRSDARRAGRLPVLEHEYEDARKAADKLRDRFAGLGIVLDGESEVTALWVELADDGTSVQCRGMLDHLKGPVIYDLKSCRSAHPLACQRHIDAYGYAIQRAAYVSAIETIHPELVGRVDFIFIFFELEPPFAVTPVRMSGAFRELGECRWRRAVNQWATCVRENHWPAYVDRIIDVEPPPWALAGELDRQFAEEDADSAA